MDRRKKKGNRLSKVILIKIKEQNRAWQKYQNFRSAKNYENYRMLRSGVNSMIRNDNTRKLTLRYVPCIFSCYTSSKYVARSSAVS